MSIRVIVFFKTVCVLNYQTNCSVNVSSPFYIDISAIVSHLPTVKASIR